MPNTDRRTYGSNILTQRCFFPPVLAGGHGIDPRFRPGSNGTQEEFQWCCSARGLRADRRDKLLKRLDTAGEGGAKLHAEQRERAPESLRAVQPVAVEDQRGPAIARAKL